MDLATKSGHDSSDYRRHEWDPVNASMTPKEPNPQ